MACRIWLFQQARGFVLFSLPEQYRLSHGGSLILKLRPQEDLSYLSVIRRELNVQTLVRSLQGSFAPLRHNLFLGNRALAVVAVYCHDVMAGFFNARRHIDIVQ